MYRLYLDPRNWITALLLGVFWLAHRLLPYHFKLRILKALGRFVWLINRTRRHIVHVNLSICFPEMTSIERNDMGRRNFEHFFVSILEIAISWWGKADGRLDDVALHGAEHLDSAMAQGRGVILVGAHFSTIELGAALVRQHIGHDTPMHIVYREQKGALFNACMLRGRLRHVDSCINSKNSRQIVKAVRAKQIIWYAPDHDHGTGNAVFAPFFGHPAATLTTTSSMAKFCNTPVVMMGSYRNSDNTGYYVKFYPPIEQFPSDDSLQDATRVNQMIEAAIRVEPDQYMWTHRRFKTQPDRPKSDLYGLDPHRKKKFRSKPLND